MDVLNFDLPLCCHIPLSYIMGSNIEIIHQRIWIRCSHTSRCHHYYYGQTRSITTWHWRNPFPQHDGSVHNLKNYIGKEWVSALISHAKKNTMPYIDKWLSNTKIHIKWSNLLWMPLILPMCKWHKPSIIVMEET